MQVHSGYGRTRSKLCITSNLIRPPYAGGFQLDGIERIVAGYPVSAALRAL